MIFVVVKNNVLPGELDAIISKSWQKGLQRKPKLDSLSPILREIQTVFMC